MARVIQIRDVPDEVHDALTRAAESERLSLNRFVLRELEHVARRAEAVEANSLVIAATRARVGTSVDREQILRALHEGRDG